MTRAPRLDACVFGPGIGGQWERLARVLAWTAAQHCPTWQVSIWSLSPVRTGTVEPHVRNVEKIEVWSRLVHEADDGDRMLLMDADTFITNPLDPVWEQSFDVAYTVKSGPFPFNAGVIFLRVSDGVRAFMAAWAAENVRMLTDARYHQPWRLKYGGINQAALGALLARDALAGLTVATLPCREWNCEDSSWWVTDPGEPRIVHVKSALRRAIFHQRVPDWLSHTKAEGDRFRTWVQTWRDLDASTVAKTA